MLTTASRREQEGIFILFIHPKELPPAPIERDCGKGSRIVYDSLWQQSRILLEEGTSYVLNKLLIY